MIKIWQPIFFALLLGACAEFGTALDVAKDKGAKFYDGVLGDAIFVKCRAASIGSVDRRYMQTPETWALWRKECRNSTVPTME